MTRILIALCLLLTAGCASLYKCGVFYDADTPEENTALMDRLSELRSALAGDARLEEMPEAGYLLRFVGREDTEFWRLAVVAFELRDSSSHIEIACPYDERNSERVQKLRALVENALGAEVMQRIRGEVRYTMLAYSEEPIQSPKPTTARAAVGRTHVLFFHTIFDSLAVAAQL